MIAASVVAEYRCSARDARGRLGLAGFAVRAGALIAPVAAALKSTDRLNYRD